MPPSQGLWPVPAGSHSTLRVTVYGWLSSVRGFPAVWPGSGCGFTTWSVAAKVLGPLAEAVNSLRTISSSRAARSDAAIRALSPRVVFRAAVMPASAPPATIAKMTMANMSSINVSPASRS